MNIFKGTLFSLSLLFCGISFGQDAKSVLDKLSAKVKSYSAMYVEYDQELVDEKAGGSIAKESGQAWLKGDKFKVFTPDFEVYCNAVDVWAFVKDDNSCSINYYEELQEEKGFNPADIFTIWETGFKQEHKGKEGSLTKINLYPTDSENPFHTITLLIDEGSMQIKKASMKSRDGQEMIYSIKTFDGNPDVSDTDFKFNEADYPGVEMDDQRF